MLCLTSIADQRITFGCWSHSLRAPPLSSILSLTSVWIVQICRFFIQISHPRRLCQLGPIHLCCCPIAAPVNMTVTHSIVYTERARGSVCAPLRLEGIWRHVTIDSWYQSLLYDIIFQEMGRLIWRPLEGGGGLGEDPTPNPFSMLSHVSSIRTVVLRDLTETIRYSYVSFGGHH